MHDEAIVQLFTTCFGLTADEVTSFIKRSSEVELAFVIAAALTKSECLVF